MMCPRIHKAGWTGLFSGISVHLLRKLYLTGFCVLIPGLSFPLRVLIGTLLRSLAETGFYGACFWLGLERWAIKSTFFVGFHGNETAKP